MNQLSFLDLLTIASFAISLENLEENIEAKDEPISDVNILEDSAFDEALLFF